MRLVGRILLVLAAAGGPAVVVLIGCGNNDVHQPPLANEIPNHPGGGLVSVSGGAGSSSSSSGCMVVGNAAPAQTVCDCAATLVAGCTPACATCQNAACLQLYTACATCGATTGCVNGCMGSGSCIAGCISNDPGYASFMNCMLTSCATPCGQPTPLACPLDAGTNG